MLIGIAPDGDALPTMDAIANPFMAMEDPCVVTTQPDYSHAWLSETTRGARDKDSRAWTLFCDPCKGEQQKHDA